jgi:hypothetical protein
MIFAVAGAVALTSFVGARGTRMETAAGIATWFRVGGEAAFVGLQLAGALLIVPFAWLVARATGAAYTRGWTSDQSLLVGALWLLFGLLHAIPLANYHPAWFAGGLVAFAAYLPVARVALSWVGRERRDDAPVHLLLLRVFALGHRSERLFDALRTHWLHVGGISLIAGPDLATTTVEPHEFLDFLRGRLARSFVTGEADLASRLQAPPPPLPPDRRHRIDEFFCHEDSWQATLEALVARTDVVLMDLRSFSASNQGCLYELGRLLDTVDLARVVVVIDGATDRAFLQASLEALWSRIAETSPNRAAGVHVVRLVPDPGDSSGALYGLLGLLLAECSGKRGAQAAAS